MKRIRKHIRKIALATGLIITLQAVLVQPSAQGTDVLTSGSLADLTMSGIMGGDISAIPVTDVPVGGTESYIPVDTLPGGYVPSPNNHAPTYDSSIYLPDTEFVPHEGGYEPYVPETGSTQGAESTTTETETTPKPYNPPTSKGVPIDEIPEGAKVIDAPYINQRASWPNGCEAVSAVMLLQYLGVDISAKDFIYSHLDMGRSPYISNGEWYACDPREQYPGNPANSSGWGCYPEVIKKAVDSLSPEGYEAFVLKDVPLSTLCSEYIDNDIPVVFWGTIDMRKPTVHVTWNVIDSEKDHTWISPFHCLLLVGYDDTGYYFNDPWQDKLMHYSKEKVELSYSGIGREALVILEKEETSFISEDSEPDSDI